MLELRAYGVTDKGRIRETNEDCFAVDGRLGFCVVADGMGGHNAGEIAARMAVDTVAAFLGDPAALPPGGLEDDPELSTAGNRLRAAIHLANARIVQAATSTAAYVGMGTTVVAAIVEGGRLSVGHVGDSRLYLLSSRCLRPLTSDDSWAATVLAGNPGLDPAAMQSHPLSHALTNVVGAFPRARVHMAEYRLQPGDVMLLTTDGVHGVLDDRQIEQVLAASEDVREAATAIVETAIRRGSRDNCTAVVARPLLD